MSTPGDLSDEDRDALLRWRLALGPGAESAEPALGLAGLGAAGGAAPMGLRQEELGEMDEALSFVYEERSGSLARSRPYIPRWLAALRGFFTRDAVALVQKDAIEKKGLTQLLFEPETLPFLEKNVELVATLVAAKGMIPDEARETARQIIREVVEDIQRQLESEVRTSIIGAVRRDRTSPLRVARNIDWPRTLRRNLKGWDSDRKRLVPERFYFWQNQRKRRDQCVAVLVDQSGSMAESVVYSSVMAAIFASIDVLETRLLFFDTEVVDMTPQLVDPVDVIFTAQLGGGTDINRAVAYAEANFVERPDKTLLILVSDLFEGGNRAELFARMQRLVESKVKVLCLLSLSDEGRPAYDHETARELIALGIPCFGCAPKLLGRVMERVLKGDDLAPLLAEDGRSTRAG